MDHIFAYEYRMSSAPWLHAIFYWLKAAETGIQLLVCISRLDKTVKLAADLLLESIFKIAPDHKNHFAESGFQGIIDRIVDDSLTTWAYGVNLLESTVTITQTCRQD